MDIKRATSLQGLQTPKLSSKAKPESSESSINEAATPKDSVQFTATAQDLKQAFAKLESTPVVNTDRIMAARDAISNGSYTVDAEKIAEKMIQMEHSLSDN